MRRCSLPTSQTELFLCDRRGGRIVTVAAEGRLDHPDVVLDVNAPVTDLLMLQNGLLAIATQYGVAVVMNHTALAVAAQTLTISAVMPVSIFFHAVPS